MMNSALRRRSGVRILRSLLPLLLLAALGFTCPAQATDKQTAEAKGTNAPPAAVTAIMKADIEAGLTKSVFVVPTTPDEGRNPFYPKAKVVAKVPKEKEQSLDSSVFVLNGITGPPLRSAMINGRTFIVGEEGEVRLQSGAKILIKCAEIGDESAVIVVGGVQRELRLRFGI